MPVCLACLNAPGGICDRHEDAAEQRAQARAERRAEQLYGDQAEARFEARVYGEDRWY